MIHLAEEREEREGREKEEGGGRRKGRRKRGGVLTQLNITKADNSKMESQSLELLENIEADEAECEEIQNQINEQKQHLEQLRTEVETLAGKYQAQIDKIQAEWDQVAQTIPEKPLEIFKRVTKSYDGQAVAVILKSVISASCLGFLLEKVEQMAKQTYNM